MDNLRNEANKVSGKNFKDDADDRFWKPTRDKSGNGQAIIRFLPSAPDGEDSVPYVRVYSHGTQGPGGWFIEDCPSTISKPCPMCEVNHSLWNSGEEYKKEQARKQKRRTHFIANILVVKDYGNPDNDGTVKLFKFGKKIFERILTKLNPEFEGEEAINPFDMFAGCDFKLKIKTVESYPNYDASEFGAQGPVNKDEAVMEKIYNKTYSVAEFVNPENFKSYDELKARLSKVLNGKVETKTVDDDVQETPKTAVSKAPKKVDDVPWAVDEGDEDLAYFKALAEDE
jgi:ElaB/YqjD/DUF883 family membrane-anchored ribosome-binding protein